MPPPPLPPPTFLRRLVLSGITPYLNKDSQYRWDLLVSDYLAAILGGEVFHARGVVTSNIPDLTAFTLSSASNDGITYVEGDTVLLPVQTNSLQDGPYIVGTPNPLNLGVAPLTRPFWWDTASVIQSGTDIRIGSEGSRFYDTVWFVAAVVKSFVVDTGIPTLFPRYFKGECTLLNGTVTVSPSLPIPILNGFSQVFVQPIADNNPNNTVRYTAPQSGISPGPIGTGQFVAQAERADGTVNVADQSLLSFLVVNDGGS